MCIVKWMDSRSVLIASTSSGSHPLQSARRWDKVGRKYINIDCPNAILRYNQCMGGVDLADRYVSYYRIAIRTKKWPLKVFWHFVDVAACNSWILYKRDKYACGENKKNIMDLLDFKFYIAECLIADATIDKEGESSSDIEYEPPTKKVKRKVKPLPPKDVRTTQNKHLPICAVSDKNKFVRCRKEGCNQKTRFKCISCDIFLCINNDRHCFMEFHSYVLIIVLLILE